jgi:uncharacterized protein (UPF0332 family)
MTHLNDTWDVHRDKGAKALEEARTLMETGLFDAACERALGSCFQIAKAVSIRLQGDRDPTNWAERFKALFRDGRLPPEIYGPYRQIMVAHEQALVTARTADADRAATAIQAVDGFHRVILTAAELTASRQSSEVRRAAAKKRIPLPPNPFAR